MADLRILAEDWPAINRCLDEALALEAEERDAWCASLAERDSVVASLRQLLAHAAAIETEGFLESPPLLSFDATDPDGATPGAAVGPYRLLRELGAGGMGRVWLAERVDGGLRRPVALKLPRLAWSSGLVERMARERDILAALDHPNIARIHDAGVDDRGRPYLALEYVQGEAIDVYCRRLALPVRERLHLVLQVARAVAHAHARLVVHRDLKPANILVSAQGQVRLLDFGIAKLIEGEAGAESPLTRQTGRALTPDYASPEQIRGEPIGTASDVYSLGVVAYELLADAKPYRLARPSAAALEEAIATVDVRLASSAAGGAAARALRGDLDAILNHALKKDVGARYASVEAFAQDIERHLADLPVLARPDAPAYRARRFLRRNRLAAGAALAVAGALVAGLAVATWQAREALAQAERAESVKAFALSVFDDADSIGEAGTAKTAADLLLAARERVRDETGGRPEVAVELMTAIGVSMVGQGLMVDAGTLLQQAADLSTRELGALQPLTCAARMAQGEALVELGRNDDAIVVLSPCIDWARARGEVRLLNTGLRWLSTAQFNAGQVEAGVDSARAAVDSLALRVRAGKPPAARDVMLSYQAYADALGQADRPGAVAAAERALAAAHEIYGDRLVPSVIDIRSMLALARVSEGQVAQGVAELDALIPATVALLGPRHSRVSKIAHLVGHAKLTAGDVSGAIVAFERSLAIEDASGGNSSRFDRGIARFFLGSALAAARRPEAALPLFVEAEALLRASAGADSPRTLRAASAVAWQLAEAGRLTESEAGFRTLEGAPWSRVDLAAHQHRMAVLRSLQGRHDEALQLAEAADASSRANPNRNLQARGRALLGRMRLLAGDARAAMAPLQEALALFAEVQLGMSPERADALLALGQAQAQAGDLPAALLSIGAADRFWLEFDAGNRQAGLARLQLALARFESGERAVGQRLLFEADNLLRARGTAVDQAAAREARQRWLAATTSSPPPAPWPPSAP